MRHSTRDQLALFVIDIGAGLLVGTFDSVFDVANRLLHLAFCFVYNSFRLHPWIIGYLAIPCFALPFSSSTLPVTCSFCIF